MGHVSDSFLLEVAGISASLLGFYVVGVFFYVDRSIFPQAAELAHGYLKAAAGSVLYLYGMAVLVSLGLVVFSDAFVTVIYFLLSGGLVWSVARTNAATRRLHRAVGVRVLSQTFAWFATTLIAGIPWMLGGVTPTRPDFAWGLMLVGVFAFISTASFVLSAFDLSALEASAHDGAGSHPQEAREEEEKTSGQRQVEGALAHPQSTVGRTEKK